MSDELKDTRPAYNGWGHETSASYADAHEGLLYSEIKQAVDAGKSIKVLDLACGLGTTSVRLVDAGANVVAVDLNPETKSILENLPQSARIQFVQSDIRQLPASISNQKFDYILFQRALDCVPGSDGISLLKQIEKMLKPHGRLYLTVSSPEADYANGYMGASKPLKQRFDKLSHQFQDMHHFFQPICMWWKDELAKILRRQDWKVVSQYLSKHGSNKVIAEKKHWAEKRATHTAAAVASVTAAGFLAVAQLMLSPSVVPEDRQNKAILSAGVANTIGDSFYYALNKIENDGAEKTLIASDDTLMNRNKTNYLQFSISRWPMRRKEITVNDVKMAVYYEPRYHPSEYALR